MQIIEIRRRSAFTILEAREGSQGKVDKIQPVKMTKFKKFWIVILNNLLLYVASARSQRSDFNGHQVKLSPVTFFFKGRM